VRDFGFIGGFSPEEPSGADPEFLLSCVNSFSGWPLRIRVGEHPESTVSG